MTTERQKIEALRRMGKLYLHANVIDDFIHGVLNASERDGILYWLNDRDKEIVRDFEEKHNSLVYHVIKDNTEFGELLSLLYVSSYEDEWEDDYEDLEKGNICVYVENVDEEMFSEFGFISIKPTNGGLKRTA